MVKQQSPPVSANVAETSNRLHEIAQLLLKTHHLGPQTQQALAELADELGSSFEQTKTPLMTTAPLVESIAHVAEALHHGESQGSLEAARSRLWELVVGAESQA